VNIPSVGAGNILVSLYSGSTAPSGSKLALPIGGGVVAASDLNVTGGWYKTGIYSASMAATGTLTALFDVWHSGGTELFTSSISPNTLLGFNNAPTEQYASSISNLKDKYRRSETARFRLFVRNKDWSPTIYTVSNNNPSNETIVSASYRIYRVVDNLEAVGYGTGSDKSTYLSYDVSGNYFDLDMSLLQSDYAYGIKLSYYNGSSGDWVEQPEDFKFRVEES
jgi:hypothetical protein